MLVEVIVIIFVVDLLLGQIMQNYLGFVVVVCIVFDLEQQQCFFVDFLCGVCWGNVFFELGFKWVVDFEMCFVDVGDYVIVSGKKFYFIGVLLVYYVFIVVNDEENCIWYVVVECNVLGLIVIDDWLVFGQCIILSGIVIIDQVKVLKMYLILVYKGYFEFFVDGVIFQIIQVVVDVGIVCVVIVDI